MLLALDFIVQWPPIFSSVTSSQGQVTSIVANQATRYEYEAIIVDAFTMPLLWYWSEKFSVTLGGSATTEYVSQGAVVDIIVNCDNEHSITKCYDSSGAIINVQNDVGAICEFNPSHAVKQRGGRGAYTKRKVATQPHHFIYEVAPIKENGVKVTCFSDVEFFKKERFTFIKQLPKVRTSIYDVVMDIMPQPKRPNIFEYEAEIVCNDNDVLTSSEVEHVDYSDLLLREEEEILCYLATDIRDNMIIVSMKGHNRNDDDELLEILGYL